ncbi:uncharacterized protein LOC121859952, partial [Homarus americanus]|uniref:uncharacterized protein LOC121859952 n=1 Tax=Homarus americanus TaxID=6706 RepID=UPI001C48EF56
MVHINHQLLSTQVTALTVKNDIIFIGEGQHLHVHNINTGAWLSSVEVFRAAVIHGIQFHSSLVCQGDVWRAAVFGQKSLAVLWFDPRLCLCRVLLEERHFDDWIVDAAWEDDASHVVLALAHNSLLRYQIQNLVESIKVKSVYESNQRGANSKSLEAQDKMVDPREENTCFHYDRTSQMSVLKAGHRSDTQRQKLSIYHKRDRFIVATAESSEKCVLFCGRVVMMSGSWESAVLLAGMVSQQLVVWGAWGDTDDNGTIVPLHSLIGHQGSIFSVNFCHDQKVITTTSDDRSIIVWDIIPAQKQSDKDSHPTSAPMDPEQERHYWRGAHIVQKLKCYGHSARVWRSLILSSCILSVGEDSKVCVWDHEGTLFKSWKAHDGSSIWSIAATECQTKVITGGGDGSVKSWSLNTKSCSAAESLVDLPWTAEVPRSSDEVMNKKSLQMENFTNNFRQENEDYEPSSDEDTHIESSNCKTLMKDKMKILKKSEGQGKLKGDFPRCVSLLGLNNYLVVMDSGKLYCWMKNSASWCLSCEDKRLENYVVMETCPDQKLVAIGTLCGDVIILGLGDRGIGVLLEEKVCEGKVFGLTWLAQDHLLVCRGSCPPGCSSPYSLGVTLTARGTLASLGYFGQPGDFGQPWGTLESPGVTFGQPWGDFGQPGVTLDSSNEMPTIASKVFGPLALSELDEQLKDAHCETILTDKATIEHQNLPYEGVQSRRLEGLLQFVETEYKQLLGKDAVCTQIGTPGTTHWVLTPKRTNSHSTLAPINLWHLPVQHYPRGNTPVAAKGVSLPKSLLIIGEKKVYRFSVAERIYNYSQQAYDISMTPSKKQENGGHSHWETQKLHRVSLLAQRVSRFSSNVCPLSSTYVGLAQRMSRFSSN